MTTAKTSQPQHQHFKVFKPYGYLSQFLQEPRKHKKRLGELYDFPEGTMAIGRLDHDSEGLLLLTTQGMMSHRIRSQHIEKEYYAQLDGDITPDAIAQLEAGVMVSIKGSAYTTQPCKVRKLDAVPDLPNRNQKIRDARHGPTSWISIILTEGKNRQVRKMTAASGFPTLRLVRVRIGDITLDKMQPGEVTPILLSLPDA